MAYYAVHSEIRNARIPITARFCGGVTLLLKQGSLYSCQLGMCGSSTQLAPTTRDPTGHTGGHTVAREPSFLEVYDHGEELQYPNAKHLGRYPLIILEGEADTDSPHESVRRAYRHLHA